MKDPIERQDAIDALADYIHNVDKVIGTGHLSADDCKDAATSVLEDVPSAQPEIVRCKECKHWDGVDTCDVINAPVWDDDFCSMAERRSDE